MINKILMEKNLRKNEYLNNSEESDELNSLSLTALGFAVSGANLVNPGISSAASYLDR